MTTVWRRPSVYSTDNELSMAQTDELLVKKPEQIGTGSELADKQGRALSSREKTIRIWTVYLIGFIDLFGVSMMIPFLPRLAQNVGASPTMAGLLGSFYGALQVFSGPVMGKMSDVYSRKSILLLSYLGPCVGYFMMSFSDSLLLLFLSRIPTGILKHGLSVCKAYLTDITDNSDRQSVLGLFNALSSLGFIFGPLISGYLATVDSSLRLSFGLGAAVFGVNLFLVAFCLPSVQHNEKNNRGSVISLKALFESINIFKGVHMRPLADIMFVRFLLMFAVIMFRTNFPVLLDKHFHADNTTLGKIMSLSGVIGALSAASCGYVSSFYSSQTKQVTHFTVLLAISITGMTLSQNKYFLILFLITMAMSTANLRICILSLILQRCMDDEKGAVIGAGAGLNSVSRMLAPSVVGVGQEYGSETVGYICASMTALALLVLVFYPIKTTQKTEQTYFSAEF